MKISDFLASENVMPDVKLRDKKQVLQSLAKQAALATGLGVDEVTTAILKREELGSTGVGNGVALPHARLHSLKAPFGLLARLPQGIDFEAIDEEPVDIVFLLLLPESTNGEQLNALACAARALRSPETLRRLRSATDGDTFYQAILKPLATA